MPIGAAVDKSKEMNLDWLRYKASCLMISDHYFKLGIVVAITDELLEKQHEVDLAARFSHQFFYFQDRMFRLNTRDERMGFSLNLKTHAQTSLQLLHLMLSIPQEAGEPEICVRNRNRQEEIFWPAPLSETEAPYLYPWTSQKGPMPSKLAFQTYVTAGEVFGWSLEGMIAESEVRVPMMKCDMLDETQIITRIVSLRERPLYEVFLLKSFWQFTAFLESSSATEEIVELIYHLPYYDYMLFGVGLFLSNKITLPALGSFFKCILDKRIEYTGHLHGILVASKLKLKLNCTIESPFANMFGPIECLLERVHWDDRRADMSEFAMAILSYLHIPSSLHRKGPAIHERDFVVSCKKRLLEGYDPTEKNPFYRALHHAWSDAPLDDINTLADLLKLGASLMIAASAHGKQGVRICSWLPISEQEKAVKYDRCRESLNRGCRGETLEEKPYPSIMNVVLLEPAVYSPANPMGHLYRFRESCRVHFVKLVDKGLLDVAMVNALDFSEGKKHPTPLKEAFFSTASVSALGFFGHPETPRRPSDHALNSVTQSRLKKIPFIDFCTFFPWISSESRTMPHDMSSKDKVRFLLQSSKKEVLVSMCFKSPNEFNHPQLSDSSDDALQYQLLTATFHAGHISAMRFIRNAKHAKNAAITFDATPSLLSMSLTMLAMLPEEYSCRVVLLRDILKTAKELVSETLVQLIRDHYLTFEEANELIQELLQATSQLTPFINQFFPDEASLLTRQFIKFLTLALERNLGKSAAALNVIYEVEFLSATSLLEMIKKWPKYHWRTVLVSMLIQYPDNLSKYLLLMEMAEFDQESLFHDADAFLDTYDDLSPDYRAWIIENEIRPLKEYVVTARNLSADELLVLQYYFMDRKDLSLAHLEMEAIRYLGQDLINKSIIDWVELEHCEEIPKLESERHTLGF